MQDGSLWAWGLAPLGDGSRDGKSYPVLVDNGPWLRVFAGRDSSGATRCYGIKRDGSLWGWGSGLPALPAGLPSISSMQLRPRLSSSVTGAVIDNGGNYTSTPSVSVVQQGGSGAVTSHASVLPRMRYSAGIASVVNPGSNYLTQPVVEISAAGLAEPPAGFEVTPARFAVTTRHPVASVSVTSVGSGYESPPQVVFQFGGGTGASGVAVVQNGAVVAVDITNQGSNYTSAPTVRFEGGNPLRPASGNAVLGEGYVASVTRLDGGHYTHPISLRLSAGNAAVSFPQSGVVEGIQVIDGGAGYTSVFSDRPLLQFSHGSASGYCTLAPSGIHALTLQGQGSVSPPQSDDTSGTVPSGQPAAIAWPFPSQQIGNIGLIGYQFDQILSAELVDGNDRRPLAVSGSEFNFTYSVPTASVGWKNRPLVRVIAKNRDIQGASQTTSIRGVPCLTGCPNPGFDLDSLPTRAIADLSSVYGGDVWYYKKYAIAGVNSDLPGIAIRTSHGRAAIVNTAVFDHPKEARPYSVTRNYVGLKSQAIFAVANWIPPVRRTIDLSVVPRNAFGCGAKLRINVGPSGSLDAAVIEAGNNYTEEPEVVIPADAATFPRLIDPGPGWLDVAVSSTDGACIGIKNGLLYKWTGLLGPPARVGKRLDINVTPKDKHSSGLVAGHFVAASGFDEVRRNPIRINLSVGLIVDFPTTPGGAPFVPDPAGVDASGGTVVGGIIGRRRRPHRRTSFGISTDEKFSQSVTVISPQPSDFEFFEEFDGEMMLVANPGSGYLEVPNIEVSQFCDFNVSPQLIGPDECVSVSSAGGRLWALDSEGTLWEIGPPAIVADRPPDIEFGGGWKTMFTATGERLFGTNAIYEASTTSSVSASEAPGDYHARLAYGGLGYSQAAAAVSFVVQFATNGVGGGGSSQGEMMCYVPYNYRTFYETAQIATTFLQGPEVPYVDQLPLSDWRGTVYSPGEFCIQSFDATFYRVTRVSLSVNGAGAGASFEVYRASRTFLPSSRFSPDPVAGMNWQWIAGQEASVFYGKLTDQRLMGFASNAIVLPGYFGDRLRAMSPSHHRTFYPYPSATFSVDTAHGDLAADSSSRLFSIGSPSVGPEKVRGSVELIVDHPGSGYTEPIVAQFSDQPSGVATAQAQLDGSVVAVGVTNPGSGWSSPPSASIAGNAEIEVMWGGPIESVAVLNGGSGYVVPPRVRFSAPGIFPEGVIANISGGSVISVSIPQEGGRFRQVPQVFFDPRPHIEAIDVTSGGSGYTIAPSVAVVSSSGSGAAARCELNGSVDDLTLTSGGGSYSSAPQVVFEGGGGSGASASCQISEQGVVRSISLISGGSGYTSPPAIRLVGGGGGGAFAACGIKGPVARVIVTSVGSGYETAPQVFFQGGSGDGAQAVARMAASGSGASATARIDGRVLGIRVTEPGSGYQSSPAVVFTGGENFKASGQELRDSEFMPRAQARISGSVKTVTIKRPGQRYRTGNVSAHDVNGENIQANPVQFVGPIESGPANPQGSASVFSNTSPGSGIESVSPPPEERKYASRPNVVFPNSWPLACRTSLRVAGVAVIPKASPPGETFLSYTGLPNGTVTTDRGSIDSHSGSTSFSQANAPRAGVLEIQGSMLGRGAKVVESWIDTREIANFPFSSPPEVEFFCDTGTGAFLRLPIDEDGFVTGDFYYKQSLSSGTENARRGSDYGPLARCRLASVNRKVIPPTAVAVVRDGAVVAVNVVSEGSGYSVPPIVVFSGGGGSGAAGVANLSSGLGARRGVYGVRLQNGGSGYEAPPRVDFVFNEPPLPPAAGRDWPVGLQDVQVEGVELTSLPQFERVEVTNLELGRDGIAGSIGRFLVDYHVFYEDGHLVDISMPIDDVRSPVFLKELPAVFVDFSAPPGDTPARVSVVRTAWENASQREPNTGRNFVAVRGS
jgi:hypothetical protein